MFKERDLIRCAGTSNWLGCIASMEFELWLHQLASWFWVWILGWNSDGGVDGLLDQHRRVMRCNTVRTYENGL